MNKNGAVQTFTTHRLDLRGWRTSDVTAHFDIYSRWEVAQFLGARPRALESPDESRGALERLSSMNHPLYGVWAIVPHGLATPVGSVLLKELPASGPEPLQPSGEVEIGWHLHPDAQGQGYATEAAARIMEHGWAGGLGEILAVTHLGNTASQAVCRRLGMEHRGATGRYYNVDCELYGITREPPPSRR